MSLKNRVGFFLILFGSLALLVFWASLQAPKPAPDLAALLISVASLLVGWAFATSKSPARPPETPPEEVLPPPPPPPKKRRGLAGLFRQRPPPAPPPAPPAQKKARRGLFRSK